MKRLIHAIVLSWGWRRRGIAFAAGALSALALAPFNAWPILFLTFPTLVWLIDGAGVGRWGGVVAAAATGWWFGFGYFVAGLYWIGYAFLVDAPTFGWLLPFAVIGLPAVLAIYTAAGVAAARLIWTRGAARILALGVGLTASEWLRGHLLHRLSVECLRLCADLAIGSGASRFGLRDLGTDLHRRSSCAPVPRRSATTRRKPGCRGGRCRSGWSVSRHSAPSARGGSIEPRRGSSAACICASCSRICSRMPASIIRPSNKSWTAISRLSSRSADQQAHGMGDTTQLIWPESSFPFFLTREADALAQITQLLPPKRRADHRRRPARRSGQSGAIGRL